MKWEGGRDMLEVPRENKEELEVGMTRYVAYGWEIVKEYLKDTVKMNT